MQLDKKDVEILALLQEDARIANAALAEKVNLSASSCWRKVKSMEDAGIIKRYAAIVEPNNMGLHFEAIVHVNLDRHNREGVEAFSAELNRHPEVVECFATTGDSDYHLRVICEDIEAYNRFMETTLFANKTVRSMRTNVVLKRIKTDAPVKAVVPR